MFLRQLKWGIKHESFYANRWHAPTQNFQKSNFLTFLCPCYQGSSEMASASSSSERVCRSRFCLIRSSFFPHKRWNEINNTIATEMKTNKCHENTITRNSTLTLLFSHGFGPYRTKAICKNQVPCIPSKIALIKASRDWCLVEKTSARKAIAVTNVMR